LTGKERCTSTRASRSFPAPTAYRSDAFYHAVTKAMVT
jgi:hypothetical protein